jgi:hypothetical protein
VFDQRVIAEPGFTRRVVHLDDTLERIDDHHEQTSGAEVRRELIVDVNAAIAGRKNFDRNVGRDGWHLNFGIA